MRVLARVFRYLRPYWLLEVLAYGTMLGITGIQIYRPQLIQRIIDVGIEQQVTSVLLTSVLLFVGTTAGQGLLRFLQTYLTEWVSQRIAFTMRNEMYGRLQHLSFSYHDKAETGQLLSRTTSDVDRLRRFTGRAVIDLLGSVVLLVSTTVILFRMQPRLAALSMIVLPFIGLYMWRYQEVIHPLWHKRQDQLGEMTSRLEQNLRGLRVVRGFAQEEAEIGRFRTETGKIYDLSMFLARKSALAMPAMELLALVSGVVIIWLGGREVILGRFSLGELVAFNTYVLQLVGPVRRLAFLTNMLGESRASADRVFEVIDARSDVADAPHATDLGDIQGQVEFQDVSFSYDGGAMALEHVSFTVPAGSVVALLGPTGSGKSTVTNLIPRFYDVTSGRILIDGKDVRDVTLASLRRQIGIVLQESSLFATTIRENIAFGRTDATQEEIEAAARAAQAHDFIMSMPEGYDTVVGERGMTLSGGQRQRVSIARALLLNPRILILDDATSSVDTDTEQQIQRALATLMAQRTSFVIAQRVSTVRHADLILVIDEGRLVAQGRHEDLIRQSGIYAEIYQRQLKRESDALEPAWAGRSQ